MALRRSLLAAAALCPWAVARAHNDPGLERPPLRAPALPVRLLDGRRVLLPQLLEGHATALQLMFTGCSATCPIQGALFAQIQQALAAEGREQLMSVTIDPLADDAAAMRAWLGRNGAGRRWIGAIPEASQLDRWFDFLRARNSSVDRHTAQVYFFNRRSELVMRSTDFPEPAEMARLLKVLSREGQK